MAIDMSDKPTRSWDCGNIRFFFREEKKGWWILNARRVDDDVPVWTQVHLKSGDHTEEELQVYFLNYISGCIPGDRDVNCYACHALLRPDHANYGEDFQLENALWVEFKGAYGMFTESRGYGGPDPAVICHECAHDLCDKIPWALQLLNPHNSHSHRTDYVESHPGHFGWDYDRRSEMHP